MTKQHCVVLADVVDSRKIDDRDSFKKRSRGSNFRGQSETSTLDSGRIQCNKRVDEFGGVISSVKPIVDIQKAFSRILHPEQYRMAAVVDLIDVNENAPDIAQMDGPAFARGDMILSELEKSGLKFRLSGTSDTIDSIISDQINLLEIIRSGWGETTMNIVREYDKSKKQKVIAEELGISAQTVSYHLGKHSVEQVLGIEQRLSNAIENYEQLNDDK